MSGVLVLGAGGHGKVVADILLCSGITVLGFLDDDQHAWGQTRLGLPVFGAVDSYREHNPEGIVLGVGSNRVRKIIAERLGDAPWINAIHPRATVARSVKLGCGIVVVAGAVINPDTVIGDHVIINTGASVDHDGDIGDYAHIAPGARLAGGVRVGQGTLIGVGAAIIPYRSVGEWATVGAGAAVITDVPEGVTAIGVPARWSSG